MDLGFVGGGKAAPGFVNGGSKTLAREAEAPLSLLWKEESAMEASSSLEYFRVD